MKTITEAARRISAVSLWQPWVGWALALLTGVLLVFLYPDVGITAAAPVALTPLLLAVSREESRRKRFLLGYGAGILYWFWTCIWIQFVLEVHGGMGRWGGWGTFLLFCLIKALHLGAFSLLAGWCLSRSYAIPLIAALWVAIERTHGMFGFAWLTLGDAAIDMPWLLRLAPITAVYGLSFVFAACATAAALLVLGRPGRELAWAALVLLVPLLPGLPAYEAGQESAVTLQPNLETETEWTRESVAATYRRLAAETAQIAVRPGKSAPQMLLWPEVPAPFYYERDPEFHRQMDQLARLTRTPVLFGTVSFTSAGQPLNSVQALGAEGFALGRYDKVNLVPFGEFVPEPFGFVHRITDEVSDFVPGTRVMTFPVRGHRAGTFICYESVFPNFVRKFVEAGAEVLVNQSNDGYFGKSSARRQHLSLVRMRAVENARWILRSTNDGYTAAIDPAGRLTTVLPPYERRVARLPFSYVNGQTFYTRWGDWFPALCGVLVVGELVARKAIGRR